MLIAIPQDQFDSWKFRPFSEMKAAMDAGELFDARALDKEKWEAEPSLAGVKYQWEVFSPRLNGYAMFRSSDRFEEKVMGRSDVAMLWRQAF